MKIIKHCLYIRLKKLFNTFSLTFSTFAKPQVSISSTFYILCSAFTCATTKSAKHTVKLSVFFALLGSALVKAARKILVKSTPGGERRLLMIWVFVLEHGFESPASSKLRRKECRKGRKITKITKKAAKCEKPD